MKVLTVTETVYIDMGSIRWTYIPSRKSPHTFSSFMPVEQGLINGLCPSRLHKGFVFCTLRRTVVCSSQRTDV